jgi:hypothetical protein
MSDAEIEQVIATALKYTQDPNSLKVSNLCHYLHLLKTT